MGIFLPSKGTPVKWRLLETNFRVKCKKIKITNGLNMNLPLKGMIFCWVVSLIVVIFQSNTADGNSPHVARWKENDPTIRVEGLTRALLKPERNPSKREKIRIFLEEARRHHGLSPKHSEQQQRREDEFIQKNPLGRRENQNEKRKWSTGLQEKNKITERKDYTRLIRELLHLPYNDQQKRKL